MTDAVRKYEISPVHTIIVWGLDMKVVPKSLADAAIAELQDKLDRAQEYARIEVKRKGEAVERECAAIERAEKAEAALAKCEQQKRGLASAAKAGTVAGNRVIELEAEALRGQS